MNEYDCTEGNLNGDDAGFEAAYFLLLAERLLGFLLENSIALDEESLTDITSNHVPEQGQGLLYACGT